MSRQVKDELKNIGTARVMVVLDEQDQPKRADELRKHFGSPDRQRGGGQRDPMLFLPNLGVVYGNVDSKGWRGIQDQLKGDDCVAGVQALRPIRSRPAAAPMPSGEISWGLERIGVPKLWAQGLSGRGVRIAHLDTGVDGTHPALAGAIHQFGFFDETGQLVPGQPATDTETHGTHTAAIIAGRAAAGRVVGVAPGAQLVSATVMEGGDVVARVLAGVEWALGFEVKILNLSLGFPGYFDEYVALLNRIRRRGVLPVFAVGNEGPDTSRSPGNYANCVSVGAVDAGDAMYPDSSSQRFRRRSNPLVPDLVMPGVDVVSANAGGGDYRAMSGTSMAAPHCSGLAALLWEAMPAATVDEVERAIFASAKRPKALERERANRGIPDAVRALQALREPRVKKTTAAGG